MRKIDNRQYKLTHIRPRTAFTKANINGLGPACRKASLTGLRQSKRGRRYDSKLDRRVRK
jgi:hypothetical protein